MISWTIGEVLEERSITRANEEPGKWGWGDETHEEELSAVGRGARPRKLPWREVVELRRWQWSLQWTAAWRLPPTNPPWRSGEEGREGAEAAGLNLDLGEECLHCSELELELELALARLSALPCRRPPPPFFLLSPSQAQQAPLQLTHDYGECLGWGAGSNRPKCCWFVSMKKNPLYTFLNFYKSPLFFSKL